MPRMKAFEAPRFLDKITDVHALGNDGRNITENIDATTHTLDEQTPELKRIRLASEIAIDEEVDVPED